MDAASNLQGKSEYINACPHLGLEEDPETHLAWVANGNYCHRAHPPQPVSHEHQAASCLDDPTRCPVYQAVNWDGSLPDRIRRQSKATQHNRAAGLSRRGSFILWSVSILLIVGLATVFWLFRPFPGLRYRPSTSPPTITPTLTSTATPNPTITRTPNATPTATFIPSPTPIITPSLNPMSSIEVMLAHGSHLRSAPVGTAAVVRFLDIGTPLVIIGRDDDELWGYVRLDDGTEGWIAMTQFEEGLDISGLPYGSILVPLGSPTP